MDNISRKQYNSWKLFFLGYCLLLLIMVCIWSISGQIDWCKDNQNPDCGPPGFFVIFISLNIIYFIIVGYFMFYKYLFTSVGVVVADHLNPQKNNH